MDGLLWPQLRLPPRYTLEYGLGAQDGVKRPFLQVFPPKQVTKLMFLNFISLVSFFKSVVLDSLIGHVPPKTSQISQLMVPINSETLLILT